MNHKTLNVLLVISKMGKGGAQRIVLDLANGLVTRGINVDLLVFYRTLQDRSVIDELDPRVKLLNIFNMSLRVDHQNQFKKFIPVVLLPLLAFLWVVTGRLKKYDIVHSNLLLASFFSWNASMFQKIFKRYGPKFVETFHADLIALPRWERITYFYLWRQRSVLVMELRRRDIKIIKEKLPGVQIEYIPFGVHPLTPPGLAEISHYKKTYSIRDNMPVILSITRLNNHEKRVLTLVDVIFHLNRIYERGFVYILVGDGPDKSNIQIRVNSLGLDNMVRFTGYSDNIRVPCSLAKIFLITGVEDLVGIAGLQAASLGVPVVSYQIDPNWRNRDPLFFNSNSPEILAEEIKELLVNEDYYRRTSARASSIVKSIFSVEQMVSSYLTLYTSVQPEIF